MSLIPHVISRPKLKCIALHSIRELAQPSTKASLTHTFTRDTRDDPWMGSAGSLLKISHVSYWAKACWNLADLTTGQSGICWATGKLRICQLPQVHGTVAALAGTVSRLWMGKCLRLSCAPLLIVYGIYSTTQYPRLQPC